MRSSIKIINLMSEGNISSPYPVNVRWHTPSNALKTLAQHVTVRAPLQHGIDGVVPLLLSIKQHTLTHNTQEHTMARKTTTTAPDSTPVVRPLAYNAKKELTDNAKDVNQLTLICEDDATLESYVERNEAYLSANYASFANYSPRNIRRTKNREYSVTFWKTAIDYSAKLTSLGLTAE